MQSRVGYAAAMARTTRLRRRALKCSQRRSAAAPRHGAAPAAAAATQPHEHECRVDSIETCGSQARHGSVEQTHQYVLREDAHAPVWEVVPIDAGNPVPEEAPPPRVVLHWVGVAAASVQSRAASGSRARNVSVCASEWWCGHYMIQPLVELYGGCRVVLKVSWRGIIGAARTA